jgi:hypothetical protein
MCSRKSNRTNAFRLALEDVKDLEPAQKKIIEERYIYLIDEFQSRANFYAFLFHTCRFIITVGSLIVPALLSIQYVDAKTTSSQMDPQTFSFQIYWTTWVISLMVTTSNGIFTLFKVDKKYFLLHTMLEQLRSEGWQFLELSGRFSGFYTPKDKPTHTNQFLYFCHAIEKLKMKQVEEEYYKSTEANLHASTTHNTNGQKQEATGTDVEAGKSATKNTVVPAFFTDGLIPPTPLNPQLQQLLQVLTVDGTLKQNQEGASEVSVRPEMQRKSTAKESLLRQTSTPLLTAEPANRMGTEIPASQVEPKPKAEENA